MLLSCEGQAMYFGWAHLWWPELVPIQLRGGMWAPAQQAQPWVSGWTWGKAQHTELCSPQLPLATPMYPQSDCAKTGQNSLSPAWKLWFGNQIWKAESPRWDKEKGQVPLGFWSDLEGCVMQESSLQTAQVCRSCLALLLVKAWEGEEKNVLLCSWVVLSQLFPTI